MLAPGINTREDIISLLTHAIYPKVNEVRTSTVEGTDTAERQIAELMLDTLHSNGICLREMQ